VVICECGCGKEIPPKRYKPKFLPRFINGHNKSMLGKHLSEEVKLRLSLNKDRSRKISLALKGRKKSPEHIAKLVAANTGKTYEEKYGEEKAKILKKKHSEMMKKVNPMDDLKNRKKVSVALKEGYKNKTLCCGFKKGDIKTEETRRKLSVAVKKAYAEGRLNHKLEHSPQWLGGKSFEDYGLEFNKELKREIIKRDKGICQICNCPGGKKRMCVHHIDYNKKNNLDSNLILLCERCHGMTNYNRDKWIIFFTKNKEGVTKFSPDFYPGY